MTDNSSYTNYLPPVLWSPDNDPPQLLGRTLRIFEKVLTGILIDARAIRVEATIVNATNDRIQVTNVSDTARFRAGDIITIVGTTERVQIDHINGAEIVLVVSLAGGPYLVGTVCIADLVPGQTTFRVDNGTGLGTGSLIKIIQGIQIEEAVVQQFADDFITLSAGLANTYPMASTSVPIRIQDGVPIIHGDHEHDYLEKTIDELYRTFNPWRTHKDFLPWLASWVALTLQKDWSEYQQRKLISEMVSIYKQRGLKKGLHTYLDIYAVTEAKPRIAIDDGDALFRAEFQDDGTALLHAIAHSNTVSPVSMPANTVTVLLHPSAINVDNNNNYIVADQGDMALTIPRRPALWKLSSTGEIGYSSGTPLPMPQPIHTGSPLENPTAVVVDSLDQYSVLDIGTISSGSSLDSAIYRFSPPAYTITTVIDQTITPSRPVTLPAVHPVDMILDGSENFMVLDRGAHALGDPPAGAAAPKIVVVSEGPLSAASHPLATVVEPTALVMDSSGRFIVADAKDQYSSNPVDLVRVDPAAGWSEISLLSGIPAGQNPLIFPTGLVFESHQSLLVCDTGVRWGYNPADPAGSDPTYRYMAETAAIYRVDLSQTPPLITRLTYERKLVHPTKMVMDKKGKLIIADRGESLRSISYINWRAESNEFGVVVLFSRQRLTSFANRNKIRRGVMKVVEEQKPGHTSWWMDF